MTTEQGRTIHVHYYAVLREESGLSDETVQTQAATTRALFDELRARHGFSLEPGRLKVVLNAEFKDWDTTISSGDTVVFLPPVAGG